MPRDSIRISRLTLNCIVGLRPDEREREQPVALDLVLGLDLARAGRTGRIGDTCDYAQVTWEVQALLRFRRYRIIEVAVAEIAAMVFGVHGLVDTVRVSLEKPRALEGRARAAMVEIFRGRADFPGRSEDKPWGEVEVLSENREAGLYLLHVDPGQGIPAHRHSVMRELEWLVSGKMERNGVPMIAIDPATWTRGRVHGYRNVSEERATLFCCDTPPFIPEDEIMVGSDEVPW